MLALASADITMLGAAADRAIDDALSGRRTGWKTSAPRSEPEAVAAAVSVGLPDTAASWTPILAPFGYQAFVTGVFCHQTPMVDYNAPRKCELADLLVVIDEGVAPVPNDRRALLVQAKIAHHPTRLSSPGDITQFNLLSTWPTFKFVGPYPQNWRHIGASGTPGNVADSADYGLIDLSPRPVAWEQVDPANPLASGVGISLGATIARMAAGIAGREAVVRGNDDWSDTVEELLNRTFSSVATGFLSQRGVGTAAFELNHFGPGGVGLVQAGGPPQDRDRGPAERENGPLSVIYMRLGPVLTSFPLGFPITSPYPFANGPHD